eukprot:jgi/Psemu1/56279/gm1.56279_g
MIPIVVAFFQVLHPHILLQQEGLVVEICKPLLDTLRSAAGTTTRPTKVNGAIATFRAEAGLHASYRKRNVLLRDLPSLGRTAPPVDSPLTAAVTALADHQLRLSENLDGRRNKSSQLHTVREV